MTAHNSTATIKFFSAADDDTDSDSEGSAAATSPKAHKKSVNSSSNPFLSSDDEEEKPAIKTDDSPYLNGHDSDDSDYKVDEKEESIYDLNTSQDYNFSRSSRLRTDSDSNMLYEEEGGAKGEDELLIGNMMEDHFGVPGDLSRLKDVNHEIEKLKQHIYVTPDDDPDKRELIEKLIGLRIRKSELEDTTGSFASDKAKAIYGHEFLLKETTSETERFCEVCSAVVWGVIHIWYTCKNCHVCCHDKCLNALKRMCAAKRVTKSSTLSFTICRERGLSSQNYKCFECQAPISYKPGSVEPRQCDYTGYYYCPACHWNDEMIIPARVLHNWDFEPHRVCRASKQYLRLMHRKPVINIEKNNKYLLNFVEELSEMKKLRQEILLMKVYFLTCQAAMNDKLLLMLGDRQHFVENSDKYTLYDLVELLHERLLPVIINVHASFASHIKVDCATCKGKGYYCEVCKKSEILFPFDNICVLCSECSNVFHKYCYTRVKEVCPRCERKKKRQEENERKAELLRQIEEANSS